MSTRIDQLLAEGHVNRVDSDNDLFMVHFAEPCEPIYTQHRGDVYSWQTKELVCGSMGLINESDWTPGNMALPNPIYEAPPGTVLRVFNHNGVWRLCTNRRLDAFTSKWGNNVSFGEMFMRALGIVDLKELGLYVHSACAFLLVSEEWVDSELHGVYRLPWRNTLVVDSPCLSRIRPLPIVSRATAQADEPKYGYMWFDGWSWMRYTSRHYREQVELQGNRSDPRERYMELESQPDKLAQYLLYRPSIADLKLSDDGAWTDPVHRLMEDAEFRSSVILNRGARARWDQLAADWQQRLSHPPKRAVHLKMRALEWWHREKRTSHFSARIVNDN